MKKRSVKQTKNRRKSSWKPGQSGNPRGRPRTGHALAELLRSYLDGPCGAGGKTRKDRLVERLYSAATGRNISIPAQRLIFETILNTEFEERLARLEARIAEAKRGPDPTTLHMVTTEGRQA